MGLSKSECKIHPSQLQNQGIFPSCLRERLSSLCSTSLNEATRLAPYYASNSRHQPHVVFRIRGTVLKWWESPDRRPSWWKLVKVSDFKSQTSMSSVMEFAASKESNEEGENERLDHFLNVDPTLSNSFSLSADIFLKAAIALKNQVVLYFLEVTWKGGGGSGDRSGTGIDPTVYTGLLGTAFTCLRSYDVAGNRQDLLLAAEIVDACVPVACLCQVLGCSQRSSRNLARAPSFPSLGR
ncbi:hypothetical protein F3Y22_tig00111584pilonHSYRG00218 [Hibiscus syriacus]|uniref:Uncharacterized protein n=1 Tax=Hibiscus syriacus TaxID=106335 RepID=A0A6A2Y0G1_HIBSY|nr:hypothetical protein F3Y22_tig00111584pilonHSYRG00218 [Hibiscus syriacus]